MYSAFIQNIFLTLVNFKFKLKITPLLHALQTPID